MKVMAWLVVLAGATAPLAAQQHRAPRGMPQGGMMHGDMMPTR